MTTKDSSKRFLPRCTELVWSAHLRLLDGWRRHHRHAVIGQVQAQWSANFERLLDLRRHREDVAERGYAVGPRELAVSKLR